MKVKALRSFAGIVNASNGEILDIKDTAIYTDLKNAGYITDVEGKPKVKRGRPAKAEKN